jgi:superfamily II DNA/RNA helicase
LDVFRERYIKRSNTEDLHDRIKKVAKRTLREQVKPYVNYTDRIARTIQFKPSGDEQKLYTLIDDYLHREKLYAFAKSQRHLSALIIRKRLGSSTYATASTLRNIIDRMEGEYQSGVLRDNRGGMVAFDDLTQDEIEEAETTTLVGDDRDLSLDGEKRAFYDEINELRKYEALARSITTNVKAEKLTEAIRVGFDTLQPGAARKAIIFTESTKTQEYLATVLEKNGFEGKYILFNGSNNDKHANEIYRKWLQNNSGSDIVTGVESSDRRKSLIDKFKEDGMEIMIATEAAAEGINLQFCSLLINYDLPWNPQRVEQRIGRIHRMGQKFDVVVVNFNNQGNVAEQRILELLEQKYQLFKGTFGASNEVLGSIEDGLDFERRISDILNACRTDQEIRDGFEQLQEEHKDQIAESQARAQSKIFDDLDPHVQDRFKNYQEKANEAFNRFEQLFMNLTRYELREFASFEEDGRIFNLEGSVPGAEQGVYFYKTDRVPHARQYKYISELSDFVRNSAKNKNTPPAKIVFDTNESQRVSASVKKLQGKSGILTLQEVTFPMSVQGATDQSESYIVASAKIDSGEVVDQETALDIIELYPQSISPDDSIVTTVQLRNILDAEITKLHDGVKQRNSTLYLDKKDMVEQEFRDKEAELQIQIDKIESQIIDKEKAEKQSTSNEERLEVSRQIQKLRQKRRELRQQQFDLEDTKDQDIDKKLTLVEQALDGEPKKQELFTIAWSIA